MRLLAISLLFALTLSGCKKEEVDYDAADKATIEKYIKDHKLNAKSLPSGLYYVIDKPGTGAQPTINSTVTVHYEGYLTDGTVFDSSKGGNPRTFSLGSVIKGWQQGIPLFKEGGEGMLLIPSSLGYGSRGSGSIPANSVLIFEVELIDVL